MSSAGNPDNPAGSADCGSPAGVRILVVRLSAMGDVIHALPAVASLKSSYPGARLTWVIEPRWAPLLEQNRFVDRVVLLRRDSVGDLSRSWNDLRSEPYDLAVDFQGLMKSALVASCARPAQLIGFQEVRERPAGLFYTRRIESSSAHVVDRNLDLAAAAGAGAIRRVFPIPPGAPEGDLPSGDFVLACPLAGWRSKQWPMECYSRLAERLVREMGMPLVLNGPAAALADLSKTAGAHPHVSGLPGLIHVTRRAAAVVGVDSGPLHLAAALAKPGVAIFGPTDPSRNGPYGGSLKVLRSPSAITTYNRGADIDDSMRQVSPDEVFEALKVSLNEARPQPAPLECMEPGS